ncbi:MAG: DNA mismatch repair endonuclease MutL [Trueperaceae bacterium]
MIRRLSPELIREIAAGEVVNAPVDILKELLENALDAHATRLEIELREGGKTLLRVTDNGQGISKEDLPFATEHHATSKLEKLESINTLGFRGEGLYAVRQSAKLAITSRQAHELGGATLSAQGDSSDIKEHPAPTGTTVVVTHLFDTLPARKRALGTSQVETQACLALLSRYVLHYPQLAIRLIIDDETKWHYAGGGFSDAAKFIWGAVTANRLLGLEALQQDIGIQGLISRPELTRLKRDRLFLAVNGRPVQWTDDLLKVFNKAYKELLPTNHFPVGIINISLNPEHVLVNTAPDKSRVRFFDEKTVANFLQAALEQTLSSQSLTLPLPELHAMDGVNAAPRHAFPALKHIGVYHELYLLAEADGQLWVIDQHAAHERILFEELSRKFKEEPALELDHPEIVPLSQEEMQSYMERKENLAELGLELEPFGAGRWRVRRVPAFLVGFPTLTADVVKGTLGKASLDEAWRAVLGRLACLPAIKAGHRLSKADAQTLLNALRQCETPWACPHGRPTALVLSELELARRFGRRGARAVERVIKE